MFVNVASGYKEGGLSLVSEVRTLTGKKPGRGEYTFLSIPVVPGGIPPGHMCSQASQGGTELGRKL